MKKSEIIYGALCYLNIDGKVLLIHKPVREGDPNSGYSTLPGGKLKDEEMHSLEGKVKGIIREVKEETGIVISNPKYIGEIYFDNSERDFDNWKNPSDFLVYVFKADEFSGDLKSLSHEGIPEFVDEEKIDDLPQYEWISSGRKFRGTIKHIGKDLYEEGTFVEFVG